MPATYAMVTVYTEGAHGPAPGCDQLIRKTPGIRVKTLVSFYRRLSTDGLKMPLFDELSNGQTFASFNMVMLL